MHLSICLLLCLSPIVLGFESGAPASTCATMRPGHDASPQNSISPYRIEATALREGDVQIEIVGNEPFKGFIVNARLAANTDQIVPGRFAPVDRTSKPIDCNDSGSGLTHTNNLDKTSVRAVWTPPPGFNDDVVFFGTVVKDYSTLWMNHRSSPVHARGTGATRIQLQIPDFVYDQCGTREGCFGIPLNCIDSRSCKLLLSYKKDPGSGYTFTMTSIVGNDKYVAAGLSDDSLMGDDSVVECLSLGSQLELRESYNVPGRKQNRVIRGLLSVSRLSEDSTDGVHTCQWRRRLVTTVEGKTYDLQNGKYYLLLAYGSLNQNGSKQRHDIAIASSSVVDLAELRVQEGENLNLWVQIHATLMLVAWLFTASLGMMLARHFKNVWEDKMPCGVKMWFACHRTLMSLTLILSIAGVAIMFYRFGIWGQSAGYHPIFGVICVALCIFQPIMALFRCHPGTKHRPVFNWFHWFIGNTAQIAGVVTIFLAVDLDKARLKDSYWFIWLIVAFVLFHVICHIVLQIHAFHVDRKVATVPDIHLQSMGSSTGTMGNGQQTHTVETKDAPGGDFRRFMLGLYIVGLMFIVGFMLATIWMA